MFTFDVRADDLRHAIEVLNEVDDKSTLQLKRDLKSTASQMASTIQTNISAIRPLSGMTGQTAYALTWGGAKATVSYSMTGNRRRDVTNLLSIKVSSPPGQPGYIVSEFAGNPNARQRKSLVSRTKWGGSQPGGAQGAYLIAHMVWKFGPLKGKGGNRIAWKMFVRQEDKLNRAAMAILDNFMAKVSSEVGS